MKNSNYFLLPALLLSLTCCHKNNSSIGSWTYAGGVYTATGASFSTSINNLAVLTANTGSSGNSGVLSIFFPYQPVVSGTYKVVGYTTPLDSNQLYIEFIDGATNFAYFSTGCALVNANVRVSSSGKVSVSVPSTYLADYANPIPDSAQLTAVINQQ